MVNTPAARQVLQEGVKQSGHGKLREQPRALIKHNALPFFEAVAQGAL
jgi:hypothetical protein